jgi:peptidoglycan/LPS O-acetylase OafA/YrhL
MIATAALRFHGATRFPGYAALLPTIGAALVIASRGATSRWSANRLLETAHTQYFGDRSYTLYL